MVNSPSINNVGHTVRTYSRFNDESNDTPDSYNKTLIQCSEFPQKIQRRNMVLHMKFVHNLYSYSPPYDQEYDAVRNIPASSLNIRSSDKRFLRPECKYKGPSNTTIRYHFTIMYTKDTLIGIDMRLHQCSKCGMFLREEVIQQQHWETQT